MKKRLILILAALSLLLSGCASKSAPLPSAGSISVYRALGSEYRNSGELLQVELTPLGEGTSPVRQAADALMAAPDSDKLRCPLPDGVEILDAEKSGNTASVFLNSDYLDVAGMDKTIADACITLTMCSVEGVDFVNICVGSEVIDRGLSSEDFLLFDNVISSGKAKVRIYYPKVSEKFLGSEYKTISFDDDNSAEREILDAMFEGPSSDRLKRAFPIGTIVMSVYTIDGVCSVSLSGISPDDGTMTASDSMLAVYAVVDSLTSLSGVKSVQILIDGKQTSYLWGFDISYPLSRNESIIGSAVTG